MRKVVGKLTSQTNDIISIPGRKNLSIICAKLIAKYPEALQDRCGNGFISVRCTTIMKINGHAIENKTRTLKYTVISLDSKITLPMRKKN